MQPNPYQAPAVSGPPGRRQVVFSDEGLRVVKSLSTWMGFVGILYYIGATFCGVWVLSTLFGLGHAPLMVLGFAVAGGITAAFLVVAGTWLRRAGTQFQMGVGGDDVTTIGAGFRTLRRYLILFGIAEGLQLAAAIGSVWMQ